MGQLGATLLVTLGLITSGALTAQAESPLGDSKMYCAVLIGESAARGVESPTIGRACSTKSRAEAKALMIQDAVANRRADVHVVISSDLLMTWFEDIDYGGDSADIYGDDGPCDSAGYELRPETEFPWDWGNKISSAAGTETCDMADFISQSNTYGQTFNLPVPWIGSTLSDNVGLIRTWND